MTCWVIWLHGGPVLTETRSGIPCIQSIAVVITRGGEDCIVWWCRYAFHWCFLVITKDVNTIYLIPAAWVWGPSFRARWIRPWHDSAVSTIARLEVNIAIFSFLRFFCCCFIISIHKYWIVLRGMSSVRERLELWDSWSKTWARILFTSVLFTSVSNGDIARGGVILFTIVLPSIVGSIDGYFRYSVTSSSFISLSYLKISQAGRCNYLFRTLMIIVVKIWRSPCMKAGMNLEAHVISRVTCDLVMLISQ